MAAQEFEGLQSAPVGELRERWKQLTGGEAPASFRADRLARALAYTLQAKRHGDLPAALRRELRTLADGSRCAGKAKASAAAAYAPGTRLLRSWRGVLHEVTVRPEGYEWRGDSYRSLSRVAFEITGTKWNGLRFFGVRTASKAGTAGLG